MAGFFRGTLQDGYVRWSDRERRYYASIPESGLAYKKLLGHALKHFGITLRRVAFLGYKINVEARFAKFVKRNSSFLSSHISVKVQRTTAWLPTSWIVAVICHQKGDFRHFSKQVSSIR